MSFPLLPHCSQPLPLTPHVVPGGWEFSGNLMFQKLVKIEDVADVAVSFILEEWGHLDPSQKSLCRDDRKENYGSIPSMGKNDASAWMDILMLLFHRECFCPVKACVF